MELERELLRLTDEAVNDDELPPEGEWSEWSPAPFGRPTPPPFDEPLDLPQLKREPLPTFKLRDAA